MAVVAAIGFTTYWFWFFVPSALIAMASIGGCIVIWSGHRDFIRANPDMYGNIFALTGLLTGGIGIINGSIATLVRFIIL